MFKYIKELDIVKQNLLEKIFSGKNLASLTDNEKAKMIGDYLVENVDCSASKDKDDKYLVDRIISAILENVATYETIAFTYKSLLDSLEIENSLYRTNDKYFNIIHTEKGSQTGDLSKRFRDKKAKGKIVNLEDTKKYITNDEYAMSEEVSEYIYEEFLYQKDAIEGIFKYIEGYSQTADLDDEESFTTINIYSIDGENTEIHVVEYGNIDELMEAIQCVIDISLESDELDGVIVVGAEDSLKVKNIKVVIDEFYYMISEDNPKELTQEEISELSKRNKKLNPDLLEHIEYIEGKYETYNNKDPYIDLDDLIVDSFRESMRVKHKADKAIIEDIMSNKIPRPKNFRPIKFDVEVLNKD